MKILVTNSWGWYQDPHLINEDTRITRGWLTCSRSGVWSGAQGLPYRCSHLGGFIAHHSTSLETKIVQLELLISPGHTKVLGLWDTQRALHNQRGHCLKAYTLHLVPQFWLEVKDIRSWRHRKPDGCALWDSRLSECPSTDGVLVSNSYGETANGCPSKWWLIWYFV